jgi:hypothetical protein
MSLNKYDCSWLLKYRAKTSRNGGAVTATTRRFAKKTLTRLARRAKIALEIEVLDEFVPKNATDTLEVVWCGDFFKKGAKVVAFVASDYWNDVDTEIEEFPCPDFSFLEVEEEETPSPYDTVVLKNGSGRGHAPDWDE